MDMKTLQGYQGKQIFLCVRKGLQKLFYHCIITAVAVDEITICDMYGDAYVILADDVVGVRIRKW